MSSHVMASELFSGAKESQRNTSSDNEVLHPGWSEYFKFLAAAGAIGTALFLGPLVAIVGLSFVVTLFGWLVGGLSL